MTRTKILAAATAAAALAAAPAAHAANGFNDRGLLTSPNPCATFQLQSINQFILLGANSPIKVSGTVRSCSTSAETAVMHVDQVSSTADPSCDVQPFVSQEMPLRSLDSKGFSMQAPEPACEGYYFLRATVTDQSGNLLNSGWVDYTVHVAPKT